MRVFVGIDLDDVIRGKIARFIDGVSGFAPDARFVRPESLHVTLKFIGEQTPGQVEAITHQLRSVRGGPFEIRFADFGFFPTAKAARVFWIGIHSGPELAALAKQIDNATAELGMPREERAYSPHLTLARGGGRSGDPNWRKGDAANSIFGVLQKRLAAMSETEFGRMTAGEFILFQSQLSPAGSKYTKLERFALRST
ncbi:MAG TPA: RNA 2',3'-cyclic phosphodiesterase [Terriglobales bacterium]|nr:RNA 2',3'-cyclic phosphodiesterase [Terriglobales bacterium]